MSSAAPARARRPGPGVRPPKRLLPLEAERRLTERQRQILDVLEERLVGEGLAELTMAQIAAEVNCSLRTLYGISPRKDELVLTVVDRRLHRIGRTAIESLEQTPSPLEALRLYLRAVNEAVQPTTAEFVRDFADVPGATRLFDAHERYVIAVTRSLLDRAVDERQIGSVDTAALAHVLGSLGREFSRPDVQPVITDSPKRTADAVAEILLRGLESA